MSKKSFRLMIAVALMVVLLSQLTVGFAADLVSGEKAKVNCSYLNVREGAGTNNAVITAIQKDTEVTIVEKSGEWYKVTYADNKEGYVYGTYLTASEVLPTIKAVPITDENFAPFGRIIYDTDKVSAYEDDSLKWTAEIDFLKGYSDLAINFLRNKQRPMIIDTLEVHMQTEELFIPMNESPAILVVAPAGENVDLATEAKAFYIEPGIAYLFNKGVPHWITYPTSSKPAEYCVITTTGTGADDTAYLSFPTQFKISY
jgi:ureidoglycolate hydrolase